MLFVIHGAYWLLTLLVIGGALKSATVKNLVFHFSHITFGSSAPFKNISSFKYVRITALKLLALYCLNCLVLTILGNTSLDINHTMVADSQMNDS